MIRIIFLVAFLIVFVPLASFAAEKPSIKSPVVISNAHSFETGQLQKVGAALMRIDNNSDKDDQLIAAYSPVCGHVELHTMFETHGIMRMREIEKIDVPAKNHVELTPQGFHLMLMDLKAPLKAGQNFPLVLTFKHAGEVKTTIVVKSRQDLRKALESKTTPPQQVRPVR
jgi:periplasmic copper chaperone A